MRQCRNTGWKILLQGAFAPAAMFAWAVFVLSAFSLPAFAGPLLPEGFFDRMPEPGQGQFAIEADYLSQDSRGVSTASGQVVMRYAGYLATSDRLVYDRNTNNVTLVGNVVIRDPQGTEYASDQVEVTGNMKKVVMQSLVMVTEDGAMVTASYVERNRGEISSLENGTYSPCGTCIDSKGRRIGWRVRTDHMLHKERDGIVEMKNPVLEVLGVPVAWVPWMAFPDPTNPRNKGFRLPSYAVGEKIGLKVTFPYFMALGNDVDLLFEPSLMSRQVALMSVTVDHRFGDKGAYSLTGSGTYVVDRSAFAGTPGDLQWRGALQASAEFTPSKEWKFGAAYSLLSDRAYLRDYILPTRESSINHVSAQYLTPQTFADARVQEFVVLGDATQADQNKQGVNLPVVEAHHIQELGDGWGQVEVSGTVQNVSRAADSTSTANGVTYVEGFAENKAHGTVTVGWRSEIATDLGLVFTPYVGLRADVASYDGGSALMPGARQLFTATPIAALDVRYPFAVYAGGSTHIIEPTAQVVYHGSSTTNVGITNDNAQSFVFDDTNLLSYNRFSGTDRQETGLRVNWGWHYLAEFADGSFLDVVHGKGYHLAGSNALGIADAAQTGNSSGGAGEATDHVIGVQAGFNSHFKVGGKAQFHVIYGLKRAAVAASVVYDGWQLGLDYSYRVANAALGAPADQQDLGGYVQVPLHEYWYARAAAGYNLTTGALIDHSAGLTYDDGYFTSTLGYTSSGADPFNPASQAVKWTFALKTPDGGSFGTK